MLFPSHTHMSGEDSTYFNPHEDGDEGRGQDGELEAGLPGGRGEEVINQHNEAILRQQARAKATVEKGSDETRDALKNTPMGPELRPTEAPAPIAGDDETADKYGEGDGARDSNDNLIPGYPADPR